MTEEEVDEVLRGSASRKRRTALFTKKILFREQAELAKELGIFTVEKLDEEILNRSLGKMFPK